MQTTPKKKRRRWRVALWAAALLLLIALAFQLTLDLYVRPRLVRALDDLIVKGSDSLYRYSYKTLQLGWLNTSLQVNDLHIFPDSSRYRRLKAAQALPALVFSCRLGKGEIGGLELFPLLFSRRISLDKIGIDNAMVQLSKHFHQVPPDAIPIRYLYQKLQPDINGIYIGGIHIANLQLSYRNADSARAFHWKFDKGYALFKDIAIDKEAAQDARRVLYARNFFVGLQQVDLKTGNGLYNIKAKTLTYATDSRELLADSFRLYPALAADSFYKKIGKKADRYFLSFPVLRFRGLDLRSLLIDNRLGADSVSLKAPVITVYNDKTQPLPEVSKLGKYPHQLLSRLPLTVFIRKLYVTGGKVAYSEKAAKTGETGTISFSRVHGTLSHITNDSSAIARNALCVADLHARFLDAAPLHAVFTFFLDRAREGKFAVDAALGALQADELNKVVAPFAPIRFLSFSLKQLQYHISGTQRAGSGFVKMAYDSLNLQPQRGDGQKKRPLLTFLVRNLVVFPANPMPGKALRMARNVRRRRVATRSFFWLIWKTLLKGAEQVVMRGVAKELLPAEK